MLWRSAGKAVLVALAAATVGSDPAADLVRIRVLVTTTASNASVTLRTGVVAHHGARLVAGSPAVRIGVRDSAMSVSLNTAGRPVEAEFLLLVARVSADAPVEWSASQSLPGTTGIEIHNVNRDDRPALVDRFDLDAASADFRSPSAAVRAGGPLPLRPRVPPLVLAHYYPWYTVETWRSPEMLDHPLPPYSTDDSADVLRTLGQAKAAGIDAMIVSWQGGDVGGGFNARRMELVLRASERLGMVACTYLETLAANPESIYGTVPTDPEIVFEWIADIVDRYGTHPAHLRVDGRPVVFVYTAWRLEPAVWEALIDRLRRSGRNPLILGEGVEGRWLDPFGGIYRYINIEPLADIEKLTALQSLRSRTYHLLEPGRGERRIWAATVSPGFDDSLLSDRPVHTVRDRRGGAYYDDQWRAALASAPDWILITSWNEWWENTHIEPSERYGDSYLRATRAWTAAFRGARLVPRERHLP